MSDNENSTTDVLGADDPAQEQAPNLTEALRKESTDVKDCFTRFSFAALAFSAIVLTAMVKLLMDAIQETAPSPWVCFALSITATVPILILFVVQQIGITKYSTSNRNLGYVLHLDRTSDLREDEGKDGWKKEYRAIGWEQAMRAWRVVQCTQYVYLHDSDRNYEKGSFRKPKESEEEARRRKQAHVRRLERAEGTWAKGWENIRYLLRRGVRRFTFLLRQNRHAAKFLHTEAVRPWVKDRRPEEKWFDPRKLVSLANTRDIDGADIPAPTQARYYQGTYLGNVMWMLNLVSWVLLIPLVFTALWASFGQHGDLSAAVVSWSTLLILVLLLTRNYRRFRSKTRRLASCFTSIHSCAVMWQAVVVAHFRARRRTLEEEPEGSLDGYTEQLGVEARRLSNHIFEIHRWIAGDFHRALERETASDEVVIPGEDVSCRLYDRSTDDKGDLVGVGLDGTDPDLSKLAGAGRFKARINSREILLEPVSKWTPQGRTSPILGCRVSPSSN